MSNTSVKKIEYFIDYGTPKMTFLFYFQPFLLDGYFITQNERSIRFMKKMLKRLCTGFLALATVVTALPTTPVHAESKLSSCSCIEITSQSFLDNSVVNFEILTFSKISASVLESILYSMFIVSKT